MLVRLHLLMSTPAHAKRAAVHPDDLTYQSPPAVVSDRLPGGRKLTKKGGAVVVPPFFSNL